MLQMMIAVMLVKKGPSLAQEEQGEKTVKKQTKNWAFFDVKRTFLNTAIQKGKHSLISPMWKYETFILGIRQEQS